MNTAYVIAVLEGTGLEGDFLLATVTIPDHLVDEFVEEFSAIPPIYLQFTATGDGQTIIRIWYQITGQKN